MSKKTRTSKPAVARGGGAPGYAGYVYQRVVSVWAALDLVLAKRLADGVELEPISQEDIEARLAEDDPGRAALAAQTATKLLVIQAKLKSRGAWDATAFKNLIKHGGDTRVSARERLKSDSSVHYLLVTTAACVGVIARLSVNGFAVWPDASLLPASIRRLEPAAAGRVAVLDMHRGEVVRLKVKELLLEAFRVPFANWEACMRSLEEAAEQKMIGHQVRVWSREELQAIIREHGGYFAAQRESDRYVRPRNWDELTERLRTQCALVISGRSGTGKTATASALFELVRANANTAARHVRVHSPNEIDEVDEIGTVFFEIVDPWGQYRLEPGSEAWNDRLPGILRSATPSRLFVVTTRTDVLGSAEARKQAAPWLVELDVRHYGKRERRMLYELGLQRLPRRLQELASDHEAQVLSRLTLPLEIEKFFDELFLTADEESVKPRDRIANAIQAASDEMIEATVARHFTARAAEHWAPVLWGLLKAIPNLSRELLARVEQRLGDIDDRFEDGVELTVNFLVAGRNLRQTDSVVTYSHPRVGAGLEALIVQRAVSSRKAFRALIDVLVGIDSGGENDWGREVAATVTAGARDILELDLSAPTEEKIDAWLARKAIQVPDAKFADFMRMAARAGSARSMVGELARLLMEDLPERMFFSRDSRQERNATRAPSWYDAVSADAPALHACHRFVKTVLAEGRPDYGIEVVGHVERIAGEIPGTFREAAMAIVAYGPGANDDAVAEGALRDIDGFDPVLSRALDEWFRPDPSWSGTRLAIENGEYSEAYASHLSETAGEDGYTAGELVAAYVAKVRKTREWQALAQHPQSSRLLHWWLGDVIRQERSAPVSAEELAHLASRAMHTEYEADLWRLAEEHWRSDVLLKLLTERLLAGHPDHRIRQTSVLCLARHAPEVFQQIATVLLASGHAARLLVLLDDLQRAHRWRDESELLGEVLAAWLPQLPDELRQAAEVLALPESKRDWKVSVETAASLQALPVSSREERLLKVAFGATNRFDVSSEIESVLFLDSDVEAEEAFTAVVLGLSELVERSMGHKFARVVAESVRWLAQREPGTISEQIRALAGSRSRYIAEAVMDVLGARVSQEYEIEYLVLAHNDWSALDPYMGGDDEFPIARRACEALHQLTRVDARTLAEAFQIASNTRDRVVRLSLFQLVAKMGSPVQREALVRLAVSEATSLRVAESAAIALRQWAAGGGSSPLEIDPAQLLQLPAPVAAELVVVIGFCGPERAIDTLASSLVASKARRVFLILLAIATANSFPGMLDVVLRGLPANHPVLDLVQSDQPAKLDRRVLDDLGDPRAVREVVSLIPSYFQPPARS